jgi:hypothetical protein
MAKKKTEPTPPPKGDPQWKLSDLIAGLEKCEARVGDVALTDAGVPVVGVYVGTSGLVSLLTEDTASEGRPDET